jgi:hypothetical protein
VPLVDPFEQIVQSQGHEDKKDLGDELARDTEAKSLSEAAMRLAVAVAFPSTISLLGT